MYSFNHDRTTRHSARTARLAEVRQQHRLLPGRRALSERSLRLLLLQNMLSSLLHDRAVPGESADEEDD